VQDDYFVATATCLNIADAADREECVADAKEARREGNAACREELDWREDGCDLTGEDRYDPDFDPDSFDRDFRNPAHPNRYFPLAIGNQWEYRSADQTISVKVLNETKLIEGVRCVVVRDIVREAGQVIEATDDWFAQAKDGTVWYCGEEVKDFETFAGDRPARPELVSIDGSFKAGRDGAKPGIIFLASPARGDVYREEFSLRNAEDISVVLSTTYAFGSEPELDRFVPRQLARRLCAGDCVVTRNISLLEPGVEARKYYAPGIGVFLEVKPDSGEVDRLVSCNVSPRCVGLPAR
jgi:hypothetical protein